MSTIPAPFLFALQGCRGFNEDTFVSAHQQAAPVSIRVNTHKAHLTPTPFLELERDGEIPWCSDAFYLRQRPVFTLDPVFHAGAYYVQEASSMFIRHALETVLGGASGLTALDLCAAPGGKSTLLASMPQFALVLANEIIQSRVSVLQENTIKWGAHHVFVSNNDPRVFASMGECFDVVLVDAPCSGSGLFRKDSDAIQEWSPEQVGFCVARQQRILSDVLPSLKEGGVLVYSTCSFSPEENEANLDYLVQSGFLESVALDIPEGWGIVQTASAKYGAHGYRFYPDQVRGEGFFCAVFKKVGTHQGRVSPAKTIAFSSDPGIAKSWLRSAEGLVFYRKDSEVFACDESVHLQLEWMQQHLKLRRSGIRLGKQIRELFIPDHELAMSRLWSSSIDCLELGKAQALDYLRREAIDLSAVSSGWKMVCHASIPLGWAKIVHGKMKNHYPMPWRILMRK